MTSESSKPVDTQVPDAIFSLLMDTEPEYMDLVEAFVAQLPSVVDKVRLMCKENDWVRLKKEVHDLKGMGGGFGYPLLTELSGRIEAQLNNDNWESVSVLLEDLNLMCERMSRGISSYKKRECA